MDQVLGRLQAWYAAQCDGDWEHEHGIEIRTLDNPGWAVHIPLEGTGLEERPFTPVAHRAGADDWMFCRVRSRGFHGSCGPRQLEALLDLFLRWAGAGEAPETGG